MYSHALARLPGPQAAAAPDLRLMGPHPPATGESDATTPSLATSNPPPEASHHPDTPALPPDWAHLTSSLISDCLCLTWSDTPDTRQALTHMLDAGQPALGYLFAHAHAHIPALAHCPGALHTVVRSGPT